jgi:hypothetical protein
MGETEALPTETVTTERQIGKTTYIVSASPSETAKDTIGKKIENLIRKDVAQGAKKEP